MRAVVEFVGYFLIKTGMERFIYDFDDESATVLDLLTEVERALRERDFVILRDGGLMNGVLVFHRKANGGMERIFTPDTPLREIGNSIVLANLMGGG
jgi:hypothetical protein